MSNAVEVKSIYFDTVRGAHSSKDNGIYGMRNCEWSMKLLDAMWSRTDLTKDAWDHELKGRWDQKAFRALLREQWVSDKVKVVDKKLFNCYSHDWRPGDFVLHAAGGPGGSTKKKMKAMAALIMAEVGQLV